MQEKKSKLLLVAMVISALYLAYSAWYWFGGGALDAVGTDSASQAGGAIATALVTPHLLLALIGAIFNVLGFAMGRRAFALTAGILYAVSMVLFPPYFFAVIIQMILCFIAFAKMRKNAIPQTAEGN